MSAYYIYTLWNGALELASEDDAPPFFPNLKLELVRWYGPISDPHFKGALCDHLPIMFPREEPRATGKAP